MTLPSRHTSIQTHYTVGIWHSEGPVMCLCRSQNLSACVSSPRQHSGGLCSQWRQSLETLVILGNPGSLAKTSRQIKTIEGTLWIQLMNMYCNSMKWNAVTQETDKVCFMLAQMYSNIWLHHLTSEQTHYTIQPPHWLFIQLFLTFAFCSIKWLCEEDTFLGDLWDHKSIQKSSFSGFKLQACLWTTAFWDWSAISYDFIWWLVGHIIKGWH